MIVSTWRRGLTVSDAKSDRMQIPTEPFVGLFGNWQREGSGTPWRADAARRFTREGFAWFDPTQSGWTGLDESNGDALQSRIDALVAHEQEALTRCACAVMYIVTPPLRPDGTAPETPLASRVELGELVQMVTPTFVFLGADVKGRNYLRAVIARAPHVTLCNSLDDALGRAADHLRHAGLTLRDDTPTDHFARGLRASLPESRL